MRLLYKTQYRGVADRVLMVVQGVASVLDGLILILTLGFVGGALQLNVSRLRAFRLIK